MENNDLITKCHQETDVRVQVLIEALPYIQKFYGKTIVIKYGGHAMVDDTLKNQFAQDVTLMKYVGINPVIVHGGGPQINKIMEKMGIKPSFVEGQRITDEETMSVVEMVLVGTINKEIVGLLNKNYGKAVGLSGRDGNLITAELMKIYKYTGDERPPEIIDIGRVGKVSEVNTDVIQALQEKGFIPVIAPVGVAPDGLACNINADLVAGAISGELKAEKLLLLTDIEGVMNVMGVDGDGRQIKELIHSLNTEEAQHLIESGVATGGMIPKLKACLKAIGKGVKKAHIIDGRKSHSILLELFTDKGVGTEITG